MDAARFDQVTKSFAMAGSRRWVLGGLLGAGLGLRRLVAGASHKDGHPCTPSDNHPCPDGQTCRQVSGAWTCEVICSVLGEDCATVDACCEGLQCCPSGLCESAFDNCDGLD